ncbi:transmembrane protein 192 isoform X2 [Leucoraja erinacea]|uniref:transmembrane protein 192 isoform X2 n=1 Tax=Leucoraja erinaceus TaxID=7782 RepID=UPI00245681D4|nr:transmembrane protein 192 isoform X2 [Leucoraja erinacea]
MSAEVGQRQQRRRQQQEDEEEQKENSSIDVTQSVEEDVPLDHPLLYADALVGDVRPYFKGVPTMWWGILLTFLHVAFVALTFTLGFLCVTPYICKNVLWSFKPLTVIIIAKVVLWILHAVFEFYLQAQHSKVRNRGYLALYRSVRHLKHLPLFIHSMVKIAKFNMMKPCPDIQEEERRHRYPNRTNILSETGFRDGSNLENLVEKQADLIDYLKMHNVQLSRRLLALISQQVRD